MDGAQNLTKATFTVDPDFACTMFNSCKKVSLIAAASLQSSEAFLDFLVRIDYIDVSRVITVKIKVSQLSLSSLLQPL
jgi:hypothetical protein